MKKSDEIKKQMDDLTDEAEALHNIAEREKRDLNDVESARWTAIMAKDTGELAKLDGELKAALDREAEVARMRAARVSVNTPKPIYNLGDQLYTAALPVNVRLVTPKLSAFDGGGDKLQAQRDAYDCGLWFKANALRGSRPEVAAEAREKLISRRGQEWFATQNETAPGDGGYLVPPAFESAVTVYREQVGALRRLARVVPMSSDTLTMVKQTTGTTVYYPGEEGAITDSDANFSKYTLSAKKRAILSYVSAELRDDSVVSIMDLLAQDMGHQFALTEDQEGIAGDGTSTYGGVQGLKPAVTAATASVYTAGTGDDTWGELDLTDFFGTMSKIADKYRPLPMSWVCSGPFKWSVMDRLALAMGGAVANDLISGVNGASFLGYPVVVTDRMPTATAASTVHCLFGAFGNAVVLGQRSGISVALSEHYKFNTDQIAVRATTRYDIHVHEEGDTSTAGAISGLKTNS